MHRTLLKAPAPGASSSCSTCRAARSVALRTRILRTCGTRAAPMPYSIRTRNSAKRMAESESQILPMRPPLLSTGLAALVESLATFVGDLDGVRVAIETDGSRSSPRRRTFALAVRMDGRAGVGPCCDEETSPRCGPAMHHAHPFALPRSSSVALFVRNDGGILSRDSRYDRGDRRKGPARDPPTAGAFEKDPWCARNLGKSSRRLDSVVVRAWEKSGFRRADARSGRRSRRSRRSARRNRNPETSRRFREPLQSLAHVRDVAARDDERCRGDSDSEESTSQTSIGRRTRPRTRTPRAELALRPERERIGVASACRRRRIARQVPGEQPVEQSLRACAASDGRLGDDPVVVEAVGGLREARHARC